MIEHIHKIKLSTGKTIELSDEEMRELKNHITQKEWTPEHNVSPWFPDAVYPHMRIT